MDSRRFAELSAQNFNRIPVYRDVFADLDTPVSAYLKLPLLWPLFGRQFLIIARAP